MREGAAARGREVRTGGGRQARKTGEKGASLRSVGWRGSCVGYAGEGEAGRMGRTEDERLHKSGWAKSGGEARRSAPDASEAALPSLDMWPDLDAFECERRAVILRDIEQRLTENGPRRSAPDPNRGRLFMPFAALEGYDQMIDQAEEEVGAADKAPGTAA